MRRAASDEWQQRFDRLLEEREAWERSNAPDPATVDEDVLAAIREVRAERARRRL